MFAWLRQSLARLFGGAQARVGALGRMMRERPGLALQMAVGGSIAVAAAAGAFFWGWIYLGLPRMPAAEDLWTYNREPGVTFLSRTGEVIGVRGPSYGRRVTLEDLPAYVPEAFLAIEDRRFYEHSGVDNMAILRAAIANITAGRTVQGGSTLSQQIAKNLFLSPAQTLRRKLQEMVLASRLERMMSKDDLLELYLNRVYLGDQAYGVDAAARRFFGRPATELTLAQAAMIAGLPKAPSRSAPTENFARAKERQLVVLDAMVEAGFITQDERDAAAAEEIDVVPRLSEGSLGYVFDMAADQARQFAGDTPDLVIQLTIDPAMQTLAQETVLEHLGERAQDEQPLQAAMVVIEGQGEVRALIGGVNYAASKFNRAYQARRQPGSSFKTFVYAAALERGMTPEDVRYDEPIVISGWRPRNYDEGYRGAVTLRRAFAQSLNTVAAEVGHEAGLANVVEVARRMGVTLGDGRTPFDEHGVPISITLGSVETSVWDMTQGFATFMLEGRRADAHILTRITNSRGDVIYTRPRIEAPQVYATELAHQMTSMMGAVVINGTGVRARVPGRDVAGKTGTSQNWRDAWFIGYTTDFTAGVWVGYDDFSSMNRRGGVGRVTGGAIPAEIWSDFMTTAMQGRPVRRLPGIEQPERSPRQAQLATFYESLRRAFSDAGDPDSVFAAPPPPDYFRR